MCVCVCVCMCVCTCLRTVRGVTPTLKKGSVCVGQPREKHSDFLCPLNPLQTTCQWLHAAQSSLMPCQLCQWERTHTHTHTHTHSESWTDTHIRTHCANSTVQRAAAAAKKHIWILRGSVCLRFGNGGTTCVYVSGLCLTGGNGGTGTVIVHKISTES